MKPVPQPGEVWFVDLGIQAKPRYAMVMARSDAGRLAVASVVLLTTQYSGTPFELALPRVPWLREQSYINAQSLQPVKLTEFTRKAAGGFSTEVFQQVRQSVMDWLDL